MATWDEFAETAARQAKVWAREIPAAERRSGLLVLDLALKQSSGSISLRQLRQEDHPYARRHGAPWRDPDVVNEQGGEFRRDWEYEEPVEVDGALESVVFNSDPKGDLLEQKDYQSSPMFARNPHEAAALRAEPTRLRNLDDALEEVLNA